MVFVVVLVDVVSGVSICGFGGFGSGVGGLGIGIGGNIGGLGIVVGIGGISGGLDGIGVSVGGISGGIGCGVGGGLGLGGPSVATGLVDTTADPAVELIKKELAGATAIRRAVRQGQPNTEALHDQPTITDPCASFGGVAGEVVDDGGCYPDVAATASCDYEHVVCKDREDKLLEKLEVITEVFKELKSKRGVIPSKKMMELYTPTAAVRSKKRTISQLFSTFKWDKDMINYVRGKRPYPHDKSWTKSKRILAVINVEVTHFFVVEILLDEVKIKFYDCNLLVFKEAKFLTHVQPLLKLFPKLLTQSKLMDHLPAEDLKKESWDFEGRNNNIHLYKNKIGAACGSYLLAYIECFADRYRIGRSV
ncbi:hypothetical protein FXO38_25063 [Capsicum annuum]|nr:hypothetical protein FXO38_25063 [Capsicum annuum]